jgi:hypothetical protein
MFPSEDVLLRSIILISSNCEDHEAICLSSVTRCVLDVR